MYFCSHINIQVHQDGLYTQNDDVPWMNKRWNHNRENDKERMRECWCTRVVKNMRGMRKLKDSDYPEKWKKNKKKKNIEHMFSPALYALAITKNKKLFEKKMIEKEGKRL